MSLNIEKPKSIKFRYFTISAILTIILALNSLAAWCLKSSKPSKAINSVPKCPKSKKRPIKEHEKIQWILHDDAYRNHSVEVFSNSIQVDTTVYDDVEDYSKFANFHKYLEENFPLVYEKAIVHTINEWGLVFEFKGSNSSLKPIMLNAHQDTVPIGTIEDWNIDPWGGYYDGEKIFGRGSSDCKNLLVGLMEAMELRISDGKSDFQRGVLFAFGFDEEKSGFNGARKIGEYLVDYLGKDSVYLIMDEGMTMMSEMFGGHYGLIMTGEKGYHDLKVSIVTPGGHSSLPRKHTSIGMMSFFLSNYEFEGYTPVLTEENPIFRTYECMAEQDNEVDKSIRSIILNARADLEARSELLKLINENPLFRYTVETSQAIDVIHGGDKVNSIPRNVTALINHRITYGNSPETVIDKARRFAIKTARLFDIGLTIKSEVIFPETSNGQMLIESYKEELETAKVTPDYGEVWDSVTGNMRSFYEDEVYPEKFTQGQAKYIIAPSLMTPNTDTRHYWDLSDNIFKVTPGTLRRGETLVAHAADEWVRLDDHLQVVGFFYNFLSDVCQ